ncbi:hypothetical protein [Streptomyces hiroshimensis]
MSEVVAWTWTVTEMSSSTGSPPPESTFTWTRFSRTWNVLPSSEARRATTCSASSASATWPVAHPDVRRSLNSASECACEVRSKTGASITSQETVNVTLSTSKGCEPVKYCG